jgi:S-adenosyl methyltransferase
MTDEHLGLPAIDTSRPSIARVYDYWLGGKDNFAADRAEAERMLTLYPELPELARENRQFLARAVAWLAGQGIRQFIDIGSGLPTARNTHQIAHEADPECRVVYVDRDPVVVLHAAALLTDGGGTAALQGDLASPDAILADPVLTRLVRLEEPVAVILAAVLHFFPPAAARTITAAITRSISPGSYLVISCGSGDEHTVERLAREYAAGTLHNPSPQQIREFFTGLDLLDPPGLTDARDWTPGSPAPAPSPHGGHILAGVGRKPGQRHLP